MSAGCARSLGCTVARSRNALAEVEADDEGDDEDDDEDWEGVRKGALEAKAAKASTFYRVSFLLGVLCLESRDVHEKVLEGLTVRGGGAGVLRAGLEEYFEVLKGEGGEGEKVQMMIDGV